MKRVISQAVEAKAKRVALKGSSSFCQMATLPNINKTGEEESDWQKIFNFSF